MISEQVLHKVLEIIGYKNNKDTFVKKFFSVCSQVAIYNCIDGLPQDLQEQINAQIQNLSVEECIKVLEKYISADEFQKSLQSSSNAMLKEYVSSIAYTLSKQQKENIRIYIEQMISSLSK